MIVAGFGARRSATSDSFRSALAAHTGQPAPQALATVVTKIDQLRPLATALGLPVLAISARDLAAQATETQSRAAHAAHATGSVAEAAALAAAGPTARLLAARLVSADRLATCALAIAGPSAGTAVGTNTNATANTATDCPATDWPASPGTTPFGEPA